MATTVLAGWYFVVFLKVGYSGGPIQVGPFPSQGECVAAEARALRPTSFWSDAWEVLPCWEVRR